MCRIQMPCIGSALTIQSGTSLALSLMNALGLLTPAPAAGSFALPLFVRFRADKARAQCDTTTQNENHFHNVKDSR